MTDVLEHPLDVPAHGDGHLHDEHHGPSGLLKWMTTTDHKIIGLSYTVTSVIMLVSWPRRTERWCRCPSTTNCSRCTAR